MKRTSSSLARNVATLVVSLSLLRLGRAFQVTPVATVRPSSRTPHAATVSVHAPPPRGGSPRTTDTTRSGTTTLSLLPAALVPGGFAASAFLPACLGFWRTGYTVSYGYGAALCTAGLLTLSRSGGTLLLPSSLHAALYALYGARLCLFLLHRELTLPVEIHQMKRRDASVGQRLKRIPLVLGCAGLFYLMAAAPMRIMATAASSVWSHALTAVGGAGFLLAAAGDDHKARVKARDGRDTLVTTGPFRYFRHPNYTGEMLGWTCAALLLPASEVWRSGTLGTTWPWLLASALGWAGMTVGVLMVEATAGLEQKQREKYGGTPAYEAWLKTSWSGPMLPSLGT